MTQPPCHTVPRPSRRSAPQGDASGDMPQGDIKRKRRPEPVGREDFMTQPPS